MENQFGPSFSGVAPVSKGEFNTVIYLQGKVFYIITRNSMVVN